MTRRLSLVHAFSEYRAVDDLKKSYLLQPLIIPGPLSLHLLGPFLRLIDLFPRSHLFLLQQGDTIREKLRIALDSI